MEKFLSFSLKVNFTPNTLGCHGLIFHKKYELQILLRDTSPFGLIVGCSFYPRSPSPAGSSCNSAGETALSGTPTPPARRAPCPRMKGRPQRTSRSSGFSGSVVWTRAAGAPAACTTGRGLPWTRRRLCRCFGAATLIGLDGKIGSRCWQGVHRCSRREGELGGMTGKTWGYGGSLVSSSTMAEGKMVVLNFFSVWWWRMGEKFFIFQKEVILQNCTADQICDKEKYR